MDQSLFKLGLIDLSYFIFWIIFGQIKCNIFSVLGKMKWFRDVTRHVPLSVAFSFYSGIWVFPILNLKLQGFIRPVACVGSGSSSPPIMQGFIRPVACVGSGDPVRVLRLYTTITLDEVCSIYC